MADSQGYFSDGLSAARHRVGLKIGAHHLVISGEDGLALAIWAVADLRPLGTVPGEGLRLSCAKTPDAILTVTDPTAAAALLAATPSLRPKPGPGRRGLWGWAAASVLAVAGLVLALPALGTAVAKLVPRSWEDAWGDRVYAEASLLLAGPGAGECRDEPGRMYIERLVARLAATAGVEGLRLHVLRSDIPNAFALPGRHIVVLGGLLDKARSPNELAGVLAHEIAHVAKGHVTRQLVRDAGFKLVWTAAVGAGTPGSLAQSLLGLSYSREAEREADVAGVAILGKSGLRRDGLGHFLKRIAREQGDVPAVAAFLSTHPPTDERLRSLATSREGTDAASPDAWQAIRAICQETPSGAT
ncbi:MAG: M48 family metallopeptidase [Alphaproteobacteria bacterium]|nr:M48 family metallopeptidase [Alphaproteobacteria bacterium]